jgi:uncharacterized protein (TIGR00255 family)
LTGERKKKRGPGARGATCAAIVEGDEVLFSMTGHGEAQRQANGLCAGIELRTINNRYFKLTLRATEGYTSLEPRVEALAREFIRRGTVYANLRIDRDAAPSDYRLNTVALAAYRRQVAQLSRCKEDDVPMHSLLQLPGVVDESAIGSGDMDAVWPVVESALREACERLNAMRREEGSTMADDLRTNQRLIGRELDSIEARSPVVVESYRQRLRDRLSQLLAEFDVTVSTSDVVREVGIFAERSDISEEIVRLRSHLDQFESYLQNEESSGRKLEFLTQEMFREANTIGSKANDAEIARHVIEIKTAIERVREMIQNVE